MEREVLVSIDLGGSPARVGRLWVRARGDGVESCSFEYERSWLALPTAFATRAGLKPKELERMESAFEHDDLTAALR